MLKWPKLFISVSLVGNAYKPLLISSYDLLNFLLQANVYQMYMTKFFLVFLIGATKSKNKVNESNLVSTGFCDEKLTPITLMHHNHSLKSDGNHTTNEVNTWWLEGWRTERHIIILLLLENYVSSNPDHVLIEASNYLHMITQK